MAGKFRAPDEQALVSLAKASQRVEWIALAPQVGSSEGNNVLATSRNVQDVVDQHQSEFGFVKSRVNLLIG